MPKCQNSASWTPARSTSESLPTRSPASPCSSRTCAELGSMPQCTVDECLCCRPKRSARAMRSNESVQARTNVSSRHRTHARSNGSASKHFCFTRPKNMLTLHKFSMIKTFLFQFNNARIQT
eukprot:6174376-Pleurochrysis_carterae.AAC.1